MPTDPQRAYASMGNYIFNADVLVEVLIEAQSKKRHDFGAHILPSMVEGRYRVYAYDFATNVIPELKAYEEVGYWRDVGTIKAFYEAHMDMLGPEPRFELRNDAWPIHPIGYEGPGSKFLRAEVHNSYISEGVLIKDALVRNSVIRSGVVIEEGVVVEDSIVMDNCVLKRNSRLRRVIVDKLNVVEEGDTLGLEPERDRFRCHIDPSGIAVLPRGGRKEGSPTS
jgi:glucose-1-phosphate adenylyltransferase